MEKHENAQVNGKPSRWLIRQDEALQVRKDGLLQWRQDCAKQDKLKLVTQHWWHADGIK